MAYVPNSGSVVAFQDDPSKLQASVTGIVGIRGNPSISGTVNVGNLPTNQNVSGSVVAFQGTTPWTINSVYGNIGGSVVAFQGGTQITSLVSTVPSSVIVGASIFGLAPVNVTNTNINVSGSVVSFPQGAIITSLVSTVPSSVIVGASIFGLAPVNVTNTNLNVSGSVAAFQAGTQITSLVSTVPSSVIVGASVFGALPPVTIAGSVATVRSPFATEFRYFGSIVSGSVTLVAGSVSGKRHYVTDFRFFNTGSVSTLITFQDGSTSILGFTGAPAGGGSNYPGATVPDRTAPSQDLAFKMGSMTSVLYATINGFTDN